MNLIVCLDNKNGMLFNKRRQSSDRVVCRKILSAMNGKTLWMNGYSRKLFRQAGGDIRVDENFLEAAGQGDYCFVENTDVTQYMARVHRVVVFRWNRTYPADLRFPSLDEWKMVETSSLEGSSHDKITREVYER